MRPVTGACGVGGGTVSSIVTSSTFGIKMVEMRKGFDWGNVFEVTVSCITKTEEIGCILIDIVFFKGSSAFADLVTSRNSRHLSGCYKLILFTILY